MKTIPTNRKPGAGAVDYALSFIEDGGSRTEIAAIITQLLDNRLHDPSSDKRIKVCDYCDLFYRDRTKPNNSKTCSKECKTANDTLKRAANNAAAKTRLSHFRTESHMLEYVSRYETPTGKLEQIEGAIYRDTLLGGKKKGSAEISYNGDEQQQARIYVRYADTDRSSSEVRVSKMTAAEIESYHLETYGELRMSRELARF